MLIATYTHLLCKRAHVRPLAAPIVAVVNVTARAIDGALPSLREPLPGTIFANYHVVAQP